MTIQPKCLRAPSQEDLIVVGALRDEGVSADEAFVSDDNVMHYRCVHGEKATPSDRYST